MFYNYVGEVDPVGVRSQRIQRGAPIKVFDNEKIGTDESASAERCVRRLCCSSSSVPMVSWLASQKILDLLLNILVMVGVVPFPCMFVRYLLQDGCTPFFLGCCNPITAKSMGILQVCWGTEFTETSSVERWGQCN